MRDDEKRVVLIKPGDVLLIGNVKVDSAQEFDQIAATFRSLGLSPVLFCAGDIQLDSLTAEQLHDLVARTEMRETP